ncbi:hypothetical protein GTY57_24810 [Streptomyces sp. SID5475]|nr:hypothetical protein [Streptomyces sp. SID5475]
MLLTSCAAERQEHVSDAGPLSANVETGATSVFAPGDHPWMETFGSYLLCSTTGTQIKLEDIRYETPVKPLKVELQLRNAPPGFDLGPITSASGQPPKFKEIGDISGQVEPFRKGVKISQKCDQDAAAHGFTELLFVVKTGKAGGHISKTWIDYTAGGDPYTLVINWQMITCGNKIGPVNGADRCNSDEA